MSINPTLVGVPEILWWGEQRAAEAQLPWLVGRLIRGTDPSTLVQGFRQEKGVVFKGWDGRVDSNVGRSYIPQGHSLWELSAEANPKKAAEKNYSKRTKDPLGENRSDSTFVFVTPHTWPGKDDWQRRKRAAGEWKDIRAYDSDDLAAWLGVCPALWLDFSRMLGKPVDSQSLGSFWEDWSNVTRQPVPPALILAGREAECVAIRAWLGGPASVLELQGVTAEEPIAFFAATLLQPTEEETGQRLLDRAVVVNTSQDWASLSLQTEPLVLIPRQADRGRLHVAVEHGHHVLLPLGPDENVSDARVLPRISVTGAREALEASGLTSDIDERVQTARHSINAYRRRWATTKVALRPRWADSPDTGTLVPALLLMHWDDQNENDRKLIERLSGSDYASFTAKLSYFSRQPDPPVRKIGSTWTLVSARDCWEMLGASVSEDQLTKFHDLALEVLGETDPKWNLADEQRWYARALRAAPQHSDALRRGISRALAVMGSVRVAGTSDSANLGACAAWIVGDLFKDSKPWQFWASLYDDHPAIAEAAPDEYLRAVERELMSANPALRGLFQDAQGGLFGSSPHVGLLWALETLAWSPDHLAAASLSLGRLTRLDPGGKTTNRPAESLARIFCALHPCTAASTEDKLGVLEMLREHEPDAAWDLLVSLLPDQFNLIEDTAKPGYRDWVPEMPGAVSPAESWRTISQAVDWLLTDAGLNGKRWKELVEHARLLTKVEFDKILDRLASLPIGELARDDRALIWNTLRRQAALVSQSESRSEYAEHVLRGLAEAEAKFTPEDAVEKHKWLFGHDAMIELISDRSDWKEAEERVRALQRDAVVDIWRESGLDGLLSLGEGVARPEIIGWILGETPELLRDDTEFMGGLLARGDKLGESLAFGFLHGRVKLLGSKWLDDLIGSPQVAGWSPCHRAGLYNRLPLNSETWDRVEKAGPEVKTEYWNQLWPWQFGSLSQPDFERAIRELIGYGRLITAAVFIESQLKPGGLKLPVEAVEKLLFAMVGHDPATEHNAETQLLSYRILELIKALEASGKCSKETVARLQYAYLPLYRSSDRGRPVALYEVLGEDPAFFIDMVCSIWRRRPEGGEETSAVEDEEAEVDPARIHHNSEVLREWSLPPGVDRHGNVDGARMNTWVDEARRLARERGRSAGADNELGEVYSHMPIGGDGAWPHEALRDLIERLSSDKFEDGLRIGVANSRGVTTRSFEDGGEQERALAEKYRAHAKMLVPRWPRTRRLLQEIASGYDSYAKRQDDWRDLTLDGLH